jgi:hypothetical protein
MSKNVEAPERQKKYGEEKMQFAYWMSKARKDTHS